MEKLERVHNRARFWSRKPPRANHKVELFFDERFTRFSIWRRSK